MRRTILVTILLLALTGLLLVAMQCDGGTAPVSTKPAATTAPGATQPPGDSAYPAATTAEPSQPTATAEQTSSYPAPAPNAEQLLNERCTKCHNLDPVKSAKKSKDEWQKTVDRMIGKGTQLTSEEAAVLVEFLSNVYK